MVKGNIIFSTFSSNKPTHSILYHNLFYNFFNRINIIKAFLIFISITSFVSQCYCANLTPKTLQNDIDYYYKISKENNLNTNDRLYILLRIQEKYKNAGIDTEYLSVEIDKLKNQGKTDPENLGKVEKISVAETKDNSKVIITTKGGKRSNYSLLRDPDPFMPNKIVLDLYGVREYLDDESKNITLENGIFSKVESIQYSEDPDYIVRITAELTADAPYKIKKEENEWIIVADKINTQKNKDEIQESSDIDNYKIEIGDVLGISVFPAEELSREVIVQLDGTISFPMIGAIAAKGSTTKQLEGSLKNNLSRYISNPQVSVSIRKFSNRQVFIMGQVRSAGAFNYKENMRLMEFISSVGGFSNDANRKEIKIYRGPPTKRQTHIVNVEEIIRSGDFSKDFLLQPGDIVEVSKGMSKVAILGNVRSPGYYDYKEKFKLLELISLSGGFTETAKISKVRVIRSEDQPDQKIIKVNLKKILNGSKKDVPLKSGDTVYIPTKSMTTVNWFVSNLLPWLTLASLIIAIQAGT